MYIYIMYASIELHQSFFSFSEHKVDSQEDENVIKRYYVSKDK